MADVYPTPKPAVKAAVAILAAKLDDPVSYKAPKTLPARFIRVSRIGGTRPNLVTDLARILVECWGPDITAVEQMSADAEAALRNAAGGWWGGAFVRECSDFQGPVDFPDPTVTDKERYQLHCDMNISTTATEPGL